MGYNNRFTRVTVWMGSANRRRERRSENKEIKRETREGKMVERS